MGFLDSIKDDDNQPGICRTCGNLMEVKPGLLGCKAHDKLIMPDYPPYYYANNQCKDWKRCEEEDSSDWPEWKQRAALSNYELGRSEEE